MAEVLSQKEIDALLNIPQEQVKKDKPDTVDGIARGEIVKGKKVYKTAYKRPYRFEFRYHSPLIKRDSIILNPAPGTKLEPGKVVVRTLENYIKHQEYKSRSK